MKFLIVGAGFFGAVCARELTDVGHDCLVVDRRDHIGGNCYTRFDEAARCHVHVYGPHIFHTDNPRVWDYLIQFASFNNFVNRPKIRIGDRLYSFPINLMTLHQVFGVTTPAEARRVLQAEARPIAQPSNMEEYCLSVLGPTLYELFIEGYTLKQWDKHPRDLPADIIKRLPFRLTFDDNYFNHRWQGIPVGGYTSIFNLLLEQIPVMTGVDVLEDWDYWSRKAERIIYTGAIDEFFGYLLGPLEYRSLRFETERLELDDYQGNAVVNYPAPDVPYTRIVEHKHFDRDLASGSDQTVITREYADSWTIGRDRFYPVHTAANLARLAEYQELAATYPQVTFGGRLGSYRYYDMDQVIASALEAVKGLA